MGIRYNKEELGARSWELGIRVGRPYTFGAAGLTGITVHVKTFVAVVL